MAKLSMDIAEAEALLGLSGSYDLAAVRRAYSGQIRLWHPDVASFRGVGQDDAAARTVLLNEAYRVVKQYLAVGVVGGSVEPEAPCYEPAEEASQSDFVSVSDEVSEARRRAAEEFDAVASARRRAADDAAAAAAVSAKAARVVDEERWRRLRFGFAAFVDKFPFGVVLFFAAFCYVLFAFGGLFWLRDVFVGVREPSGFEFVLWYVVILPVLAVNLYIPVITGLIRKFLMYVVDAVFAAR